MYSALVHAPSGIERLSGESLQLDSGSLKWLATECCDGSFNAAGRLLWRRRHEEEWASEQGPYPQCRR
jgi:hypothetical protein